MTKPSNAFLQTLNKEMRKKCGEDVMVYKEMMHL
jgi:hypothetical protein